ncbi:phosphoribosylpyrophosphate synthetase [Luteibaculum oceani]|uniref:Phosphoribosylpyrophosphate synthetase n=1 Tax=Luteibaculum oceani TaxID=1294296 RepID=A0A5C6UQW1_9FLAO|nr:phosphoribosylpyrophosphate synthetase [Luteibaculum oceani]TXC75597.1 phosphoribosylpyrophosphate synthetase [Luteibaculum oceani]
METSESITVLIENLKEQGYTKDFKAEKDGIRCLQTKKLYTADQLEIESKHRNDGNTNPADDSLLLAVRTKDGEKGTILLSYGAQHSQNPDLIRKL